MRESALKSVIFIGVPRVSLLIKSYPTFLRLSTGCLCSMFSRSYCPLLPCMTRSKTKLNMPWGVIPEGADSRSFLAIKVLTSLCFSFSYACITPWVLSGFGMSHPHRTPHIPLGDPEPQIRIILHQSWHKAWPFGSQFTSLMQISFMTSWDLIIQISYVSWHVSNLWLSIPAFALYRKISVVHWSSCDSFLHVFSILNPTQICLNNSWKIYLLLIFYWAL